MTSFASELQLADVQTNLLTLAFLVKDVCNYKVLMKLNEGKLNLKMLMNVVT